MNLPQLCEALRREAACTEELHPDDSEISVMREAATAIETLVAEYSVMARACDNWRSTWPNRAEDDHDHPDWKAAARAIIERDQLRRAVKELEFGITG